MGKLDRSMISNSPLDCHWLRTPPASLTWSEDTNRQTNSSIKSLASAPADSPSVLSPFAHSVPHLPVERLSQPHNPSRLLHSEVPHGLFPDHTENQRLAVRVDRLQLGNGCTWTHTHTHTMTIFQTTLHLKRVEKLNFSWSFDAKDLLLFESIKSFGAKKITAIWNSSSQTSATFQTKQKCFLICTFTLFSNIC